MDKTHLVKRARPETVFVIPVLYALALIAILNPAREAAAQQISLLTGTVLQPADLKEGDFVQVGQTIELDEGASVWIYWDLDCGNVHIMNGKGEYRVPSPPSCRAGSNPVVSERLRRGDKIEAAISWNRPSKAGAVDLKHDPEMPQHLKDSMDYLTNRDAQRQGYVQLDSRQQNCRNKPPQSVCLEFSDGANWVVDDRNLSRDQRGDFHGNPIEVFSGEQAEYHHVLYTEWFKSVTIGTRQSQSGREVHQEMAGTIDLIELAASGKWQSGRLIDAHNWSDISDLPWNGDTSDNRGFVRVIESARCEGGNSYRVLQTHPRWLSQGTIKGWMPWQTLPERAVFKAEVGFLSGAEYTDGVTFQVWEHHQAGGREVWNRVINQYKRYNGRMMDIQADLSHLAGQSVGIELRVDAGASSARDWAVWVNPRIESR